MASDVGTGDSELPYLDITPADGTTAATLTVSKPDGTSTQVTVAPGVLTITPGSNPVTYTQRWAVTAPVVYDQPGRTVLHWAVTGTGEGTEDLEVWVVPAPVPGGPTWTPGLSRVALYIPRLTVDVTTPGSAVELGTFTAETNPTDAVAQRHIDDAVAEVLAACGPIPLSLEALARAVAALRAAASIQLSYSNTALGMDTLSIAAALNARADADLARLKTAIADLVDGSADGLAVVVSVWSFPAPDPRFDLPQYF